MSERNLYIVTPGRVHVAVDDPLSDKMSLRTACGRDLVDGLTMDHATGGRIRTLDNFEDVPRCGPCFGIAPRRAKRRRTRKVARAGAVKQKIGGE